MWLCVETVGLQARECHLSETWPKWDPEIQISPSNYISLLNFNISAIHVFGNIPNGIIFQLQALDTKERFYFKYYQF